MVCMQNFFLLFRKNQRKGASLIEILAALAFVMLLSATALAAFSQFRTRKTMDAAMEKVLAAFSQAHLDTISSRNNKQYGVHLAPDQTVYFAGPAYATGTVTNIVYKLNPTIEIYNISLAGGGTDVLFNRLTGGTSQSGTFEVRAKGNSAIRTLVTVNGTGAVSL